LRIVKDSPSHTFFLGGGQGWGDRWMITTQKNLFIFEFSSTVFLNKILQSSTSSWILVHL